MPKSTMRPINNNKNKINNKIILIFILILTHNDDGILMVFVIATVLTWHLDYCTCHTDQDSNFSSNLLLNKKEKKKKKREKKTLICHAQTGQICRRPHWGRVLS